MEIFKSATKLVFMAMTLATIGLTFMGKVDAKDFIILASMVFSYYFTKAQSDKKPDTQNEIPR